MSRRNPQPVETEETLLSSIIDDYKAAKDEEKRVKTIIDDLGPRIKDIFRSKGLTSFSSGKYTATVTVSSKETLDEDKAIEILKENLSPEVLSKVVKTREYIDDDALEKAIYNEAFDIGLLSSCRTSKPVETLRITKKKSK